MGKSKLSNTVEEARKYEWTKNEKMGGGAALAAVILVVAAAKLTKRRREVKAEAFERAGKTIKVNGKDEKGNPIVRDSKNKPKVTFERKVFWNPFSDLAKIKIKPVAGIDLNEDSMRVAIERIYFEYDWSITPHEKGFSTFSARKKI